VYTVAFPNELFCDQASGGTSFRTGPKPGLRKVGFVPYAGELVGLDVELTEAVANPADLAKDSTLVSVTVDGFTAPVAHQGGWQSATSFNVTFKGTPAQPATTKPGLDQTVRFKLHKGLAFASGVVLAEDVEVGLVPADYPREVWYAAGTPPECPTNDLPIDALISCQASGGSGGPFATLLLVGVAAFGVFLRRRRGWRWLRSASRHELRRHRHCAVLEISGAKLAPLVRAPAPHRTGRQPRATVGVAETDLARRPGQGHRRSDFDPTI
jgi:hypothetical protein